MRITWSALTISINALAVFLAVHRVAGFDHPLNYEIWDGNVRVGRGVVDYITN